MLKKRFQTSQQPSKISVKLEALLQTIYLQALNYLLDYLWKRHQTIHIIINKF